MSWITISTSAAAIMGHGMLAVRGSGVQSRLATSRSRTAVSRTWCAAAPRARSVAYVAVQSGLRASMMRKSGKRGNAFAETINLPSTALPMQAFAAQREALFRKRTTEDLYKWQAKQKDRPQFVLHDGPPYANGELHMGHALNKILKDIQIRFQVLQGKRVHYHPGWDCHGMPIELKATNLKRFHGQSPRRIPSPAVRDAARHVASEAIEVQRERFKSYAIMADWGNESTYRTFDHGYEMRQLAIFRQMVNRGLIYRENKPVWWSSSTHTALAEAELEYKDTHFTRTIWVRFDLDIGPTLRERIQKSGIEQLIRESGGITLPIWTTTAWSLPSNMAVNVNPNLQYGLYLAKEGPFKGEIYVLAEGRQQPFTRIKSGVVYQGGADRPRVGPLDLLATFSGAELLDSTYRHPYLLPGDRSRPIIAADYVTDESGTGLVHSAPGHGFEDHLTWKEYVKSNPEYAKEKIPSPINDYGCYTADINHLLGGQIDNALEGAPVLKMGTGIIVKDLFQRGLLLCEQPLQHRSPCDWRTGEPVIIRSTPQWFANLDPIKKGALAALEDVTFVPESGRKRMENMIRNRSEWCISRQRAWGVPIPVLYDRNSKEILMNDTNIRHIESVLAQHGTDHWWKGEADEFVHPSHQNEKAEWVKGTETVDVWFDSGSSWNILPGAPNVQDDSGDFNAPSGPIADMYLEGSDQHRGWFQSSLLTYVATSADMDSASAPYKTIVTHGFTVDKKSQKMSKSLGNVISPSFFIFGGAKRNEEAFGADALRMWASRADYTSNVIVSPLVVKHAAQAIFPLRNMCRFLLSNLSKKVGDVPSLDGRDLGLLDRYVLDDLYRLETDCKKAYEAVDYRTVLRLAQEFAIQTISSLYVETSKDILYSSTIDSPERLTVLAVMDQVLRTFATVIAPIVPHVAEEIYHYYQGASEDPSPPSATDGEETRAKSVFELGWQSIPERFQDSEIRKEFSQLRLVRDAVFCSMEKLREDKFIKASAELELQIKLGAGDGVSSSIDEGSNKPKMGPGPPLAANMVKGDPHDGHVADNRELEAERRKLQEQHDLARRAQSEADKTRHEHEEKIKAYRERVLEAKRLNIHVEDLEFHDGLDPIDVSASADLVREFKVETKPKPQKREPVADILLKHKTLLTRFLNVSHVRLVDRDGALLFDSGSESTSNDEAQNPFQTTATGQAVHAFDRKGCHADCTYELVPSRAQKCPRCWTHRRPPQKTLCARCEDVVGKTHPHLLQSVSEEKAEA